MKFKILLILVIPLTIFAQETWVQTYEPFGSNSAYYTTSNLVICPDSGYAFNGSYDMWTPEPGGFYTTHPYIIRTDAEGNLLWAIGDFDTYWENCTSRCLAILNDGSFILTTDKILKLSSEGELIWELSYFNPDFIAWSIDVTCDNDIIIGGYSDYKYPMLKKISSEGELIFSKEYQYNDDNRCSIHSVKVTNNDNYLLTGTFKISETSNNYDIIIIKTNSLGDTLWTKLIDISNFEQAKCITENTDNGNILISGYSYNPDYGILALLNSDGDTLWLEYENSINGIYQNSAVYINNNNFIIDANEMYCIDENYNLIWDSESKPSGLDKYVKLLDDNYIVFTGSHSLPYNNHIPSLSKADPQGNIVSINNFEVPLNNVSNLTNFPNPFNPSTTISFSIQNNSDIELSIYNMKGQKIRTLAQNEFNKGSHSIIWNGDDDNNNTVSSGVYLYKLKVNGEVESMRKCLLLK